MDIASRALALLFLLPFLATASAEKTIYHITVSGSVQIKCKITHKATQAEPYLLLTCDYRCDRPLNAGFDVKEHKDNIYCRKDDAPTPATSGSPVETPSVEEPTQEDQ